jgi:hypothetical protein
MGTERACLLALLAVSTVGTARGQDAEIHPDDVVERSAPSLEFPFPASPPLPPPDSLPAVDVAVRFAEFQLEFDEEFGPPARGKELEALFVKRLEERLEESAFLRRYRDRGMGLYRRFEGLYERIESSTRWSAKGVRIDAEVESMIDGNVRVHAERRIHGFKLGLDINDATQGKVGLRFGGVIRGYHINLDLRDVTSGQLRLGLRKRLD